MDKPQTFRKKPVEVKAIKWTGDNIFAVQSFVDDEAPNLGSYSSRKAWEDYVDWIAKYGVSIPTPEGTMKVNVGDWIIRGVNRELYPCKPDIFEKTYEECIDRDAFFEALKKEDEYEPPMPIMKAVAESVASPKYRKIGVTTVEDVRRVEKGKSGDVVSSSPFIEFEGIPDPYTVEVFIVEGSDK